MPQAGWWKGGLVPRERLRDAEALEGENPPARGKDSRKTAVVTAGRGGAGERSHSLCPGERLIKVGDN